MPRPIKVSIHTAALAHNLDVARRHAPNAKVWAVVKANAYGHGIDNAFPGLRDTDGFGLLDLDEAVRLRELGWAGPILLLEGFFKPEDLAIVDEYGLTTTVHSDEQLRMLETTRLKKPLNIQLKMNSGMNRLGFSPERYRAAWERARAIPGVSQIVLMTHFSDADGPRGIQHQMEAFERGACDVPGERSLANSAATLCFPETHGAWVRPGIMLYGSSPKGLDVPASKFDLQPTMTLESELIGIQDVPAGGTVGYGSLFTAETAMRVGTVACGYADGYPRVAPTGTPVLVDGMRTRTIGRVSMDMLAVDLTPVPQARVGSSVTLWGRGLSIDEVAASAGTLGYELMCAVARRVPVHAN
ncbi:alanine racemase [Pandoraea apista]|uniref:alanine racemase n=1 Tax=Pandoraea apista TaxID=93218 RepID=UPI00065DDD01|nr:alanine racemase [Pandoraea apista]ALS67782.1 alanine racemase [Pandoraea apista]RRW94573.1 alanine racemase [Pandoraea apista]RRX01497.1 alanine racemase [Pandoraea apista]